MTSEAERKVSSSVVWEAPAFDENRVIYDWQKIADQLKARPGEWAKVFEYDRTSMVNAIRQGAVRPLQPANGFEVRTRNNVRRPVRMCTLYMRYNPAKDGGR